MTRLLDRAAGEIESDVSRRRIGQLMTDLLAPLDSIRNDPAALTIRDDFLLRRARGLSFAGATESAWKIVMTWNPDQERLDEDRLDALGDLEIRLGAFDRAAGTFRILIKRRRVGTIAWLDARHGLATCLCSIGSLERGVETHPRRPNCSTPISAAKRSAAKFERLKRDIARK